MTETTPKRICSSCGYISVDGTTVCPNDSSELQIVPQDPLIGKIVADRYKILSALGRGGMSVVYKAQHQFMDRMVALKMLRSELAADSDSLKRLQIESQAISSLKHPSIVPVYDFGMLEHDIPFLAMEYLEGRDLEAVINERAPIDYQEILPLFIAICDGLEHAHQNGIIHRDIKPSNIILTEDKGEEIPVIVDFGIAKIVDLNGDDLHKLTATGQVFGSPLYMSPEQCSAKRPDARSDIYAVGCVIYLALTGKTPLKGNTPVDTMIKHIQDQPKPFSAVLGSNNIPTKVELTVFKALEKEPDHRFSTMAEFSNALASCLSVTGAHSVLPKEISTTGSQSVLATEPLQTSSEPEPIQALQETRPESSANAVVSDSPGQEKTSSDESIQSRKRLKDVVGESEQSGAGTQLQYFTTATILFLLLALIGVSAFNYINPAGQSNPEANMQDGETVSSSLKTEVVKELPAKALKSTPESKTVAAQNLTPSVNSFSAPVEQARPASLNNQKPEAKPSSVNSGVRRTEVVQDQRYLPDNQNRRPVKANVTAQFMPTVLKSKTGWQFNEYPAEYQQRLAGLEFRRGRIEGVIYSIQFPGRDLETASRVAYQELKRRSKTRLIARANLERSVVPMNDQRTLLSTIEFMRASNQYKQENKNPRTYIIYYRTDRGVNALQFIPVEASNSTTRELCVYLMENCFKFSRE